MADSKPENRSIIKAPSRAVANSRDDMAKRGLALLNRNSEEATIRWLKSLGADFTLDKIGRVLSLDLRNTGITDEGLEQLKGLTNLEYFYLNDTQVTDEGLAHLTGLTNLKQLNLSQNQVTDEGLETLKGLTNLWWLHLHYTQVTDEGLEQLKEALPNCRIYSIERES